MGITRRRFLASSSALCLLPACQADDSEGPAPAPDRAVEPAAWVPTGAVDDAAFAWGLQVGDATPTAVLVSCRTTEATVGLVLVRAEGDSWVEADRRTNLVPVDGVVQLELVDLTADTAFSVVLYSADGSRRSDAARFRTATDATAFRKVVVAASSCLGSGSPGFESLERAASYAPDLFLLLGDTIYADGAVTPDDYRAEWKACFQKPAVRAMFASSAVVATWDDHEVANNWVIGVGSALHQGVTEPQVADALAEFRAAIPQRRGPDGTSMWRQLSWGAMLDVFVLDCRSERDGTDIVSAAQLAWVTGALRSSTAAFKIVMSSIHLTDHSALMGLIEADDRWQGYPAQRDALVAACAEVPGVIVITGDMHYGGVQRVDPEGGAGANVIEVAAGPAGSVVLDVDAIANIRGGLPAQYLDIVVDWSSCVLVLDPGTNTATVRFIGGDGSVLAERTL